MAGRNPRFEIEIIIIQELQEESPLRYTDLREKVYSRCQVLGLKTPSNDSFCSRLINLGYKDVLVKENDKYGGAYYSLKNDHYIGYIERTFSSLHKYRRIPFSLDTLYLYKNKIIKPSK